MSWQCPKGGWCDQRACDTDADGPQCIEEFEEDVADRAKTEERERIITMLHERHLELFHVWDGEFQHEETLNSIELAIRGGFNGLGRMGGAVRA